MLASVLPEMLFGNHVIFILSLMSHDLFKAPFPPVINMDLHLYNQQRSENVSILLSIPLLCLYFVKLIEKQKKVLE